MRSTNLLTILCLALFFTLTSDLYAQLTFDPAQIIATEDGVVTVYTADLDNDGDIDLLTTATNSGIRWWSNDGAGNLTEAHYLQQIGADAQSKAAALADYDMDGDIYVVAEIDTDPGNTGPSTIQFLINDGAGVFSSGLIIGNLAANIHETQARDFDGDGDMDVAAALFGANTLVWYENTSPIVITGGTDSEACNYDSNAGCDAGTCEYACPGFDCSGACLDLNTNGICVNEEDSGSIDGCTDSLAVSYHPALT